jgi:hypothetical protein
MPRIEEGVMPGGEGAPPNKVLKETVWCSGNPCEARCAKGWRH